MKDIYQLATEITYAQDKSIEISVDDWADKIETLLKEREEGYRAEIKDKVEKDLLIKCECEDV